jgi:hypothetical protein
MLLCTMAGIVERIGKGKRKEKIAHVVAFAGPGHAVHANDLHFFGESAVSP